MNELADVAVSRLQGELAKDGREPPMLKKSSFGKTSTKEKVKGNVFRIKKGFCLCGHINKKFKYL